MNIKNNSWRSVPCLGEWMLKWILTCTRVMWWANTRQNASQQTTNDIASVYILDYLELFKFASDDWFCWFVHVIFNIWLFTLMHPHKCCEILIKKRIHFAWHPFIIIGNAWNILIIPLNWKLYLTHQCQNKNKSQAKNTNACIAL